MENIKNLIFDLDNTLYDFSSVWKLSNKLVFEYLGYDKLTTYDSYRKLKLAIEKYIKYYNEERIQEKLGWLSPKQYRIKHMTV